MNVFERPRFPEPRLSQDGIYVVLPMQDPTYLDAIMSVKDKHLVWRYFPAISGFGDTIIITKTKEVCSKFTRVEFLTELRNYYPEDLEFFLWHPEVFEHKFYK